MFRRCLKILIVQNRKLCSSPRILTVKETLSIQPINQSIIVRGWVQSVRNHKDLHFIDLVDGTCFDRLQVIIDSKVWNKPPTYGSSIKVEGSILKSLHKGQEIEMVANSWKTFGGCDIDYPFIYHQKFSQEFIRQFLHLRPKTRTFSSILRIRNQASIAVHKFFQKEGFCFVHTPIITKNDCEGAGEVFSIEMRDKDKNFSSQNSTESDKITVADVSKNEGATISTEPVINTEEFFGSPTYLTVSGQLHLEAIASAFARVYNFGPAFRAENSKSRLHVSEFQMIEAEIAFAETVNELVEVVEKCIKNVTESLLESCEDDVNFISKEIKNHKNYIDALLSKPFVKMTYNEAINILEENRKKLKVSIKYGDDLVADHKNYLVKHCNNVPVFVSMFPSSIKPFYMKTNERNMAHCFDLFAPYGGEICGGSLREDDEKVLKEKYSFDENPNLSWYLDLRKYGSVPHGGFGIGFERFLQSILGVSNIRDLIPFPRRKWDCKC